ncbi:MAG TPA: DNA-binding transcriptional regulator [Chthoniobacterales bacterium]|nr:DNA-binding transcriptional regulator [Chthoniobacterales bacterium]
MKRPPQVALMIETSVIYGRRLLAGVARYLRSHHRWSVFLEQHELRAPPPSWLTSSTWNGILSRPTDYALARLFRRMKVPVVDLNDLHQDLNLPWVGSDHAAIGRLGAAHLLERGFRRFAFCGFSNELWAKLRLEGFRSAVENTNACISVYETPWRGPNTVRWDKDIAQIAEWIKSLPKPVGIMACNDARGLHVLDACERSGVLVPEEAAVVGVDNEEILCELCNPPLSSVVPNPERIGYEAAELLDALMAEKYQPQRRITIEPVRVFARQSTDVIASSDWAVASATRYMREQALHGCKVSDVLGRVKLSRSALEKRFRRSLNRSPKQEIRRIQIGRIQQLLCETDFTLEHIAELSGFEHPEYMNVLFKRETGQTPGQYRKQLGSVHATDRLVQTRD